mmetsp:Transcript_97113/g.313589  ORF Transcript_97113/g.313589 Transcript_97113/m.313589 type:complete len:229 (-) Transcript_97113:537-1223(-)
MRGSAGQRLPRVPRVGGPGVLVGLVDQLPRRQPHGLRRRRSQVRGKVEAAYGDQQPGVLSQGGVAGTLHRRPVLQALRSVCPAHLRALLGRCARVQEAGVAEGTFAAPGLATADGAGLVLQAQANECGSVLVAPRQQPRHLHPVLRRVLGVEPKAVAIAHVAAPIGIQHVVVRPDHDTGSPELGHDFVDNLEDPLALQARVRGHDGVAHNLVSQHKLCAQWQPHEVEA